MKCIAFHFFLYLCRMKHRFFLLVFFVWSISSLSAQALHFEKRFDISVFDSLGKSIKHPWIGGLNACIMGEIDLNFDGKNDLVVYDQHGDKIFTFLNFGEKGRVDYRYAPEYELLFPKFTRWFQLLDFNNDGLPDLFVFTPPSFISVYKNVSQNTTVKFELHTPRVRAKIDNVEHFLFSNQVDFPAFVDIDGDGDLDLLNFWVPSARNTLFYYKNHSMELYGHADSLIFILEDRQWGCFEESGESNQITLDICEDIKNVGNEVRGIPRGEAYPAPRTPYPAPSTPIRKHTGSTIFAIDLNGNSLFDLLLGDPGYPHISALYNGGTRERAKITHYDSLFPRKSTPVNLLNCPAISAIDIDNCGVKELIFSPFDAVSFSTEGYASNWVYKNMSTTEIADYQLISKRFLQEEMLDFGVGSFPTVVDIDGNGLLDIVIGNYGKIDSAWEEFGVWKSRLVSDLTLLKNIGTPTEPKFQIYPLNLTPKLSELRISGAVPTFGDINDNGKLDLLIGTECGKILWYERQGDVSTEFNFVLIDSNFLKKNLGLFLAPQLFDLNGDGLLDLIIGNQRTVWRDAENRQYFKGSITYLQNVGTREKPEFIMITDSLGRVDVVNRDRSNFGYSKPHFFRTSGGNTHLFCGNEDGKILQYTDINDNLLDGGTFRRLEDVRYTLNDHVLALCEGSFTAVAVGDFNNDGFLDIVVGNHRGGLTIFFGVPENPNRNVDRVETHCNASLRIYPNPVQNLLFIQFEDDFPLQYEILDLQGRTVRSLQSARNGQSVDVSALPTGIYLLKFVIKNQIHVQKFVKN